MIIDISKITLDNLKDYNNHSIRCCKICGKEFKAINRKQECCSQKCRQKLYYRNRKKV